MEKMLRYFVVEKCLRERWLRKNLATYRKDSYGKNAMLKNPAGKMAMEKNGYGKNGYV